jgi:drug/metabolite transporter (DMT)-like permease
MSTATQGSAAASAVRPLDAAAAALVVLLCLSWGFNQVSVKLALPDIPPLIQCTLRSIGAAAIMLPWMRWRGISLGLSEGTIAAALVSGVLFGLEFLLIYRGLLFTTASRAVLFLYTAPFIVVLASRWLFPGDRFRVSQWVGLLLSFAGIVIAFGVPSGLHPKEFIGDAMVVAGAMCWAATTLVIKATNLRSVPAEKTLFYQLIISIPICGLGAFAMGETLVAAPGALAVGSMIYQTVWVVCVTFALWYALIVRYSASRLSAFTFLSPLFGVAAGHVVLGDPITPAFAIAVVLVITGLILVNRPR